MASDDREVANSEDVYSIEDYKKLVNNSPPYNVINHINFILNHGHAYNDTECTNIKLHLSNESPWFYKLIYELPLEETPLFISHENELVISIVKWRLDIGK